MHRREEYGKERADAGYVWVLDPIDGTGFFHFMRMPKLRDADCAAAVEAEPALRHDEFRPFTRERLQRRRKAERSYRPAG